MKKTFFFCLLTAILLLSLAGCRKTDATPAPAATDEPAAQTLAPADEIAAASTPEALRALIAAYQAGGDNENAYLAASKLVELAPDDTQAYKDAITALLGSISGDYAEIQRLIVLALQSAPDGAKDFSDWVNAQNQTFSYTVPFIGDYASEAEINAVGITPGNLNNEAALPGLVRTGMLTTQGNWVYFMLPSADYYVYKMRLDGTGLTNVGDARGDCLNVVGDWLYYRNLNEQDMAYRIRTDGTQKEKLQFNKADNLTVTKDWFYYTDSSLFRAKTDGSEPERLLDGNYTHMSFCDGWIYYNTTGNNVEFMRIPAEGGEPQKLLDGWMLHYSIRDGWLYCLVNIDQYAIVRMRTDGSEKTELYRSEYIINSFDVSADKLVVSLCKAKDDRGKPYPTDIVVADLASGAVLHELTAYAPSFQIAGDNAYFLDESFGWNVLRLTAGTMEAIEAPTSAAQASSETTAAQGSDEAAASGESGNSAANLFMSAEGLGAGLVARAGTTLYFANPTDKGRFCMAEENGDAGLSKFLDTFAESINVTSDAVYFIDTSDLNSVYSASQNGENLKKIVNGPCYDLSCLGNWLFYRTADGIFEVTADGGEPVQLKNEKTRCVYAFDGFVYYLVDNEGGGLWRMPVDGGETQPLLTNHRALFYSIQGDALYCLIDAGNSVDIVRMKLDGSEQTTIYSVQEKIDAISVTETYLLIIKSAEDGVHKRILVQSLDGKNTVKTVEDMLYPAVWCFGSDVYFVTEQGLTRQNLDSGDSVLVKK